VTLESALLVRLLDDVGIAEATKGQVEWGRTFTTLPAISLQTINDPRPQHFKGFHKTRPTDVQVDIWSKSAEIGAPLREAVIAVLAGPFDADGVRFQRSIITNVRGGAEQQQAGPVPVQRIRAEVHRTSIDITFTHNA
jgi:hypothetical protein